jgi:hypothetical protein
MIENLRNSGHRGCTGTPSEQPRRAETCLQAIEPAKAAAALEGAKSWQLLTPTSSERNGPHQEGQAKEEARSAETIGASTCGKRSPLSSHRWLKERVHSEAVTFARRVRRSGSAASTHRSQRPTFRRQLQELEAGRRGGLALESERGGLARPRWPAAFRSHDRVPRPPPPRPPSSSPPRASRCS